jgi:Kdo2-lipid IVA lauroyltransferase/acyltransferase
MSSAKRAIRNKAITAALGISGRAVRTPNVAVAETRGAWLGRVLYRLDRKHRERTYSNLRLAFPEWDERRRDEVARQVFEHFGIVGADFFRTPRRSRTELLESVEVDDLSSLEEAEAMGKGVLLITAHLGNWERFAHWLSATGRKLAVVARDADESSLQTKMLQIRESGGVAVLSKGSSARQILTKLRNNEMVGILPDQNALDCYVPFFGHPAGTHMGPAVLHQRTGAVIAPAFCVRTGVGRYKVFSLPLIDPDNRETDPEKIMAEINLAIETVARKYPEQYLWLHDRWRNARKKGLVE